MAGKISDDATADPSVAVTDAMRFAAEVTSVNKAPSGTSLASYVFNKFVDTDGTLAGNSDSRFASQKAVKTYADALIAANDAMVFKGVIDCSANPNYPAADRGHTYRASVAGKIGGASGVVVEIGDMFMCLTDGTASGNQATVGTAWTTIQTNIDGAVVGPTSAVSANIATFNGTSGKLIQDSGLALDIDGALAANSDTRIPSQKAVKTYVDPLIRGYLWGLTLSAAGSTATFGIAIGTTADSTGVNVMKLASAYTKTTSAWAVGTGNGAMDTGSVAASTWYHVHLIKRPDTGVVDVLFSLSASAPTLPTNYTFFRRIGSMKTDGSSQWTKFVQLGDDFLWDTVKADVAATNPGTSAVTRTLTVPTGVQVVAKLNAMCLPDAANGDGRIFLTSLDSADETASTAQLNGGSLLSATSMQTAGQIHIRTNTSAQIRSKVVQSAAGTQLFISTVGWNDSRGRHF